MKKLIAQFGLAILSTAMLTGLCSHTSAQGLGGLVPKNAFKIFKNKNGKDAIKVPRRIVSLWSDTVLHQSGRQSTRGIAGRVYFYDEKHVPVKVEGQLVVYAFDDQNGKPENRPADRKYIFTREQLPSHFSLSDFGNSYSIWLPWDAVGGEQKTMSLVAVFRGKDNNVIVGQMARHVLPGPTQPAQVHRALPPRAAVQDVRAVSYDESNNRDVARHAIHGQQPAPAATQPGFRTTTIALPPSTQRRISSPWQTTPRERSIPGREQRPATNSRPWVNAAPETQTIPTTSRAANYATSARNSQLATQSVPAAHQLRVAPASPRRRAQAEVGQPPSRFVRPRFRPQAIPIAPQARDPQPMERLQSARQFGQPQPLRSRPAAGP